MSGAAGKLGGASRTRLDRWLWAARFYKTRGLAKAAIDGGKVQVNEARVKAAKLVGVGDAVRVRRGEEVRTVVITNITERRGSAAAAAELYQETPASVQAREAARAERQHRQDGFSPPPRRPDTQQRRRLRAWRDAAR